MNFPPRLKAQAVSDIKDKIYKLSYSTEDISTAEECFLFDRKLSGNVSFKYTLEIADF